MKNGKEEEEEGERGKGSKSIVARMPSSFSSNGGADRF